MQTSHLSRRDYERLAGFEFLTNQPTLSEWPSAFPAQTSFITHEVVVLICKKAEIPQSPERAHGKVFIKQKVPITCQPREKPMKGDIGDESGGKHH